MSGHGDLFDIFNQNPIGMLLRKVGGVRRCGKDFIINPLQGTIPNKTPLSSCQGFKVKEIDCIIDYDNARILSDYKIIMTPKMDKLVGDRPYSGQFMAKPPGRW